MMVAVNQRRNLRVKGLSIENRVVELGAVIAKPDDPENQQSNPDGR
tara:strand:+ start:935 stop:1072 length:138 start_codon:yes stop_codon:yes gene_type:complete